MPSMGSIMPQIYVGGPGSQGELTVLPRPLAGFEKGKDGTVGREGDKK